MAPYRACITKRTLTVYINRHVCYSKSNVEASKLGHASAVSVARALNTWVAMHAWSLRTITEAFAHTDGGVDHHLKNPRAMVFVLVPRKPDDNASDANNPALTFILEHGGIADKHECEFLRAQWPALEMTCRHMADAMRETLSAEERRAFAGFIPAAFRLKGTGIVAFHHFPLYRLRAHGNGPSYQHPPTKEDDMLLEDVVRLCGVLANRGFVLRARTDDNQPLPEAGLCVQIKKSWAWVPSDAWKWDSDGAGAPSKYRSQLSPAEIYLRYHKMLAHRNFQ